MKYYIAQYETANSLGLRAVAVNDNGTVVAEAETTFPVWITLEYITSKKMNLGPALGKNINEAVLSSYDEPREVSYNEMVKHMGTINDPLNFLANNA